MPPQGLRSGARALPCYATTQLPEMYIWGRPEIHQHKNPKNRPQLPYVRTASNFSPFERNP